VSLDYITIKGFKSIASIEKLALAPINVVIGANGSGKSNFIGAFSFLRSIREGHLQQYVRSNGGAEQLLHFGSRITQQIDMHISFNEEINQYSISLKPTSDDSLYPAGEFAFYWDKSRYNSPYSTGLMPTGNRLEAGISGPNLKGTSDWVKLNLAQWRLYHVHDTSASSPMRKTSQLHDNQYLRPDGSNLAAFLYLLQNSYPTEYQLIRKSMQRVAPFFDDFLLVPDPANDQTIRLAWKHRNSEQYFSASTLSDGSLRFMVLATLFLQPNRFRPSVILVDEPELGLHPYAISLLASLIKQASQTTQVILSTQSGLLLDNFKPEDVLIAERIDNGTTLKRLEAEPLKVWLEDYSLGQLWEKNELGGRPKRA
jgi:predicted ATPase